MTPRLRALRPHLGRQPKEIPVHRIRSHPTLANKQKSPKEVSFGLFDFVSLIHSLAAAAFFVFLGFATSAVASGKMKVVFILPFAF